MKCIDYLSKVFIVRYFDFKVEIRRTVDEYTYTIIKTSGRTSFSCVTGS